MLLLNGDLYSGFFNTATLSLSAKSPVEISFMDSLYNATWLIQEMW
jgi:hypothetical protein